MKDYIICRCEGVYLSDILEAIADGATSVPGIKMRKRVGMGPCQGRVCQNIVKTILQVELEIEGPEKLHLQRSQSPVRPTLLKDMMEE